MVQVGVVGKGIHYHSQETDMERAVDKDYEPTTDPMDLCTYIHINQRLEFRE
jgi:hypothetical protein